jgi:WD40 repeat protein
MRRNVTIGAALAASLALVAATVGETHAAAPEPAKSYKTTAGVARGLAFSPDGKWLSALESVRSPNGETVIGGGGGKVAGARAAAGAGVDDKGRVVGGGKAEVTGGASISLSALDRVVTWNLAKAAKPSTFNAATAEEQQPKVPTLENIAAPVFNPAPGLHLAYLDDKTVFGAMCDGRLRAWDRASGRVSGTLVGFSKAGAAYDQIGAIAIAADGKLVIACAWLSGNLQIWDVASGKLVVEAEPQQMQFTAMAISPKGDQIAVVGHDYIEIFDTAGKSVKYLEVGGLGVHAVVFMLDDKTLRTFNREEVGSLRDWDLVAGKATRLSKYPQVFAKTNGKVPKFRKAVFSADGSMLLVVRENRPFVLCDARDGKQIGRFDECKSGWSEAVFSADGKRIATTTGDDTVVKVWEVAAVQEALRSATATPGKADTQSRAPATQ